ncbi:MAG TPA: hypothetical protein VK493_03940, partial [Bryobacteraceae bacterium]|nr:hypothetical protein [Bryobacteraceae bacterium]
ALAFAGAIAVMAYITGISQLYVGRYNTGVLLFSLLALAGTVFLVAFPRYIDALLSSEEKQQAIDTAGGTFELHRVFSVVCFGAAVVLAFQTIFLRGGTASLTVCLVAVGGGLLLLRQGRKKQQTLEGNQH